MSNPPSVSANSLQALIPAPAHRVNVAGAEPWSDRSCGAECWSCRVQTHRGCAQRLRNQLISSPWSPGRAGWVTVPAARLGPQLPLAPAAGHLLGRDGCGQQGKPPKSAALLSIWSRLVLFTPLKCGISCPFV